MQIAAKGHVAEKLKPAATGTPDKALAKGHVVEKLKPVLKFFLILPLFDLLSDFCLLQS